MKPVTAIGAPAEASTVRRRLIWLLPAAALALALLGGPRSGGQPCDQPEQHEPVVAPD